MGIFSWLFRRKKEEPKPTDMPKVEITPETATIDNVKAKMELVLTELDSLKIQYNVMNQRVMSMERMVKEIYDMAKSS